MARVVDRQKFFKSIGYEPTDPQWEFHNSDSRFRIPVCGRRFGKSTMAARDLEPQLFLPKKRFWIVGPTYNLGEKEFRVVYDDLMVGQQLALDKRVKSAFNLRSGEMYIEFPWGTRLDVKSATHPESLVGDALHGMIMSEAAKHNVETWERYMRPALADYTGWATFPTTPEGHNWLYRLWLVGRDEETPEYASWRFPSWMNYHVYPGGREDPEIKLLEKTTTPEWFMQEIGADFASFVGKIYGEFDERVHVKNFEFRPEWSSYITFDWGFVNPFAAIEFQVDPQDNVYVWREHYKAYEQLGEHVRMMKARENPAGYHLDMGFGDAADPEATEYMSANFIPTVSEPEAKENWREGIDMVKKFLKEYHDGTSYDEWGRPITHPKLYVHPRCENFIREMAGYRAKDNISSAVLESGKAGGALRQDDHAMDAIRYGLVHIYKLGVTHKLRDVAAYRPGESDEYPRVPANTGVSLGTRSAFTRDIQL